MLYTLVNFPVQGYFEGAISKYPKKNQLWDNCYALVQGWHLKRSMTCQDAGYHFGRMWQAILAFEIPDELHYDKVKVKGNNAATTADSNANKNTD